MVTVTKGKFRQLKHSIIFIYHRLSRIYPTYWVYSLFVLAIFLLQPSWVNSTQGNQVNILKSFLLLPSATLPLIMVGWTLIHELYFYIIFSFMLFFIPERQLPLALLVWGGIVFAMDNLYATNDPIVKIIFNPLTIEFIGGCLFAVLYHKRVLHLKPSVLILLSWTIGIISLYSYWSYYSLTTEIEPLKWWRLLIWGIPAMLITYLLVNAERNGHTANRYLIKIGNASYSIYLSHILTLSAAGRIWHIFSIKAIYDNIVVLPVLVLLVVIVGMVSHSLIEKPLLLLSRKIA